MDDITTAGQHTLTCDAGSEQAHATSTAQATNGAAPVAHARSFDLTGTSITKIERTTHDEYTGPLAELMALGMVCRDQLPPEGTRTISWLSGERLGKGRSSTDETYVRVWIGPKVASVGLGVPKLVQQVRRRTRKEKENSIFEFWQVERRRAERVAQAETIHKLARDLADVPRSKKAFLREEAKTARHLMMVAVNLSTRGSSSHGYRIDSEALDEIYDRIDSVVEAVLDAQVVFDAHKQADAIAGYQQKILAAAPSMAASVRALVAPNPGILQGEAA